MRRRSNPGVSILVAVLSASLLSGGLALAEEGGESQTGFRGSLSRTGASIARPFKRAGESISRTYRRVGDAVEGPFSIGFDVVILRPLGLLPIIIGAGMMIPAALFSAPDAFDRGLSAYDNPLEMFVYDPVNYVFARPLGENL